MAKTEAVAIAKPNIKEARFRVFGSAPYVQHKFGAKAKRSMLDAQMSTKAKSRKAKEPRNPEEDYKQAQHLTADGKHGIPATAFRSAMISACRVAGFQMTKAKLSVFVVPDDLDADDGTPLVLIHGKPELHQGSVRLESGVASLAFRPMWRTWHADVTVRWDGDQFSQQDVANLLERSGQQVGIGEGRPDSKKSHGCGWGTFTLHKP